MKGIILYGINNIYTVQVDKKKIECRIKGKVLNLEKVRFYNPLSPGDIVEILLDEVDDTKGLIQKLHPRKNYFCRLNKKLNLPQVLASNIDLIVCVASLKTPPFRPRFIDRVLIETEKQKIPALIVINKIDLGIDETSKMRIDDFKKIGYDFLIVSAKENINIDQLIKKIKNKKVAMIGQSGAGKTCLMNVLFPGINLREQAVSKKYNRGKHTTNYGILIENKSLTVIDTPGIREIELYDIKSNKLMDYFPEIRSLKNKCEFNDCLHINEKNCKVIHSLNKGKINKDRYNNYKKLVNEYLIAEKNIYG